jgi:hypothetical protein
MRSTSARLHGAISQKAAIFVIAAERAWYLARFHLPNQSCISSLLFGAQLCDCKLGNVGEVCAWFAFLAERAWYLTRFHLPNHSCISSLLFGAQLCDCKLSNVGEVCAWFAFLAVRFPACLHCHWSFSFITKPVSSAIICS